MSDKKVRIFSLGDSALTVEFGKTISTGLNEIAIALSTYFENNPFPGFVESVPAYASTSIFYDIIKVRRYFPNFPTAFDAVRSLSLAAIGNLDVSAAASSRLLEITVHFDDQSALDLAIIAETKGLVPREVIEIFTSKTYRVFMLGFLPGFTYMGEVDDRIATPRKNAPRLRVPKGSVGIAGKQTGIYSLDSPGGWQIIGRTDVEMFQPENDEPSFFQPGDEVRFIAIE